MTNEEAKKMLEAKLKCLIAETSGTNYDCNMRLCDGCSLNYEQGNMGEQKQALDMAIKALEQQPCEDAISREALMQKLNAWDSRVHGIPNYAWKVIRELPSVTPTSEDIKESYLKGYDYGVKDWFKSKTQPCEDCVSREAVLEHICEGKECYKEECKGRTLKRCPDLQWVFDLPPVTPERPKGKWVYTPKRRLIDETDEGCVYMTDYRCTCSECGGDFGFQKMSDAYCKYCGAKMEDGEDEDSD